MGRNRFVIAALIGLTASLLLAAGAPLRAQDTRTVVEPRFPPYCKILYAALKPIDGGLTSPVERHYRDNERINKAMADCPPGKSVVLHTAQNGKSVFLIGPLKLRAGVTLVVEQGAALWASREARNYDVTPGSCGILAERGAGCKPLILAEDAPHSGIMGEGVIDGRGGNKLLGLQETWWELAHRAKVEDLTQAVPRLVVVRRSDDFTMYRITLRNSPNCHVQTESMNGFTAWGVKIDAPKWARNADGIDPQSGSTNVSIVDSYIRSGDDNISPKAYEAGGVTHMTVRNTHFYNGHGFGIGSQTVGGVEAIRVDGLTIDGSDNGIRIKSDRSRGGLVNDVHFENVCMRGVTNPIVLNPFYTTFEGDKIPVYRSIVLRNVHSLNSGPVTLAGLDAGHRLEATFDNVVVDGLKSMDMTARHAVLTLKNGNMSPAGEDVKLSGAAGGGGAAFSCEGRFVPFPEASASPTSTEIIPPVDTTFYVAADGTGDYYSVQAALNRVPDQGGLVLVAPGVYRERLLVRQSNVTLKSANVDPRKTVIVFDLSQSTQGTQQGIATVRVKGDNFLAENLTFENDFNGGRKPEGPGAQAPALALSGDRNVLRNVRLLGSQGTLIMTSRNCPQGTGTSCEPTRTYVSKSYIAGSAGFIAGDGTAFFDDCEIHSTEHAAGGFVTAQGKHYAAQESEFVFRSSRLTGDAGVANVALGRPWKDFATVVFLNPQLGAHIAPSGWRDWQPGPGRKMDNTFLRIYAPSGPGAPTASRQLTPFEASRYSVRDVLSGRDNWDPVHVQ